MRFGNKIKYIMIITGVVVVILVTILAFLLFREREEQISKIMPPEEKFVYDLNGDYGEPLGLSTDLMDELSNDLDIYQINEINARISAFFMKYADITTFGLFNKSYKKIGEGGKSMVEVWMVSNLGSTVKLKVIGVEYGAEAMKFRLLNEDDELLYEDEIKWSDVEQMDSSELGEEE